MGRSAGLRPGDQVAADGQLDRAAVDRERADGLGGGLQDAAVGVGADVLARGVASISVATASAAEPNRAVPTRVRVPVTRSPAASNSDPMSSWSPRAQ